MAQLQIAPYGRTSRTPRRPQHVFNISARPFQIVPFLLAPVLPGETMKNMLFQSRVVTDPIVNPLVGWWCEFYFWYVKHRDMEFRDVYTDMMINPATTVGAQPSVHVPDYCFQGGHDWTGSCLKRCVETYFRDQNEAWNVAIDGSFVQAQISQRTALDSALLESAYTGGTADNLVVGADDTITGVELSQSWILWQQYRASNLTGLSYEEYLATYGIPIPQGQDSMHRPELIRYVKEWSYPVNTVDPATGTPSSAVSWAISERADKDRFFREPGFIFGATCIRPKVYLSQQTGSVSCALMDALAWLPAVMGDNPEYSVRKFTGGAGPFPSVTTDYRVDLKDLFLYGDQFTNYTTGTGTPTIPSKVTLPNATMGHKYPTTADVTALFKAPANTSVRMDGVVSLNILGMQVDTSPTSAPGVF